MAKAVDIDFIKEKSWPELKRAGVLRSSLFGSFARGEAGPESDVDILVELPDTISLWDFVGIKQDLEAALHWHVDLVTYEALKPRMRDEVLAEEVRIL